MKTLNIASRVVPIMPRLLVGFGLLCLTLSAAVRAGPAERPQILVFAAASLTEAVEQIGAAYEKTAHVSVKSSFDSSSVLARQIEAGAQADIFFSADMAWMDYLQSRSLIQPATRRNVLGNRLVLIAPAQSQIQLKIAPHFALAAALGKGRLATGDPDSVPAGRYARAALRTLGVWDEIAPRLARAENVRVAMLYVARGEAALGIVYASDALVDKDVRVVDIFPADTHPPIVYPVALTRSARAQAADFVAYLTGPAGQQIFLKYGFTEPPL
jgi:molybdate transport system substrate-binding protein